MKIKNKILFILIFVLFSLFLLNSDCFAIDVIYKNNVYSLYDITDIVDNKKFMVVYDRYVSSGGFYLYVSDYPFYIKNSFGGMIYNTLPYVCYRLTENDCSIFSSSNGSSAIQSGFFNENTICCSNFNILNSDTKNVFFEANSSLGIPKKMPFITNSEATLGTGNFDYVCVNSGDFVGENWQDFYLLAYDYSQEDEEQGVITAYPRKEILITEDSIYYNDDYDGSHVYMIPFRCNRN